MGIEKAKIVLDEALQRGQLHYWLDWGGEEVKELIIKVKTALNEEDDNEQRD